MPYDFFYCVDTEVYYIPTERGSLVQWHLHCVLCGLQKTVSFINSDIRI